MNGAQEAAAGPPSTGVEAQVDDLFDRADDLMINHKQHD